MANIQVVDIRKVTNDGSLKAVVDFKINDSEFYDWLILDAGKGVFVSSPSNSWIDKDGKTKRYKQLIKFPKKLHEEIQSEILKKFDSGLPGADDSDDTPF
jgi:DNA-binding cell septation regulator SpoVG